MKLHQDPEEFLNALNQVHNETGIRLDVLEKDYWICEFLKELSAAQHSADNPLHASFRGGTALYKALKTVNRFSEDIDLAVAGLKEDCPNPSQLKNRMKRAACGFVSLPFSSTKESPKPERESRTQYYDYSPLVEYDEHDILERFGHVMVEATSFTVSIPTELLEVTPLIYEFSGKMDRELLESYETGPCFVDTQTIERIFVDKLFAAEGYYRKSAEPAKAIECAKHIYDLAVIAGNPRVLSLVADETALKGLLDLRLDEESRRKDGIPPGVAPRNFTYFDEARDNIHIREGYENMMKRYIFNQKDIIQLDTALDIICDMRSKLELNFSWLNCPETYEEKR